ncbi:hypothetical protein LWI28_000686 [Acer negundo]|uniref:Bifunctional inhibitor/plant lipid transfer protein/seed storage helical domain-containing protein n=1 Tax=Acer negundo TaxID=4023 RepID=A0AAD5J279_ACENE|nr:hypothetical protein LWI28_000686 [Acer negundo]KAK4835915.1 hypothetical protein QYF36_016294 [Acer negundo]KAK4848612.1 hypothetical protein QYF36_015151 [Acer negundo]
MEAYTKLVIVALVLGLAIFSAPTETYGQGLCGMTKDGLKVCQPSVVAENPAPPSMACCSALSKADLPCFCAFKNSKALSYYGIDFNQAMLLPAKCKMVDSFHCS